jgi:hypothetical protein
MEKDKEKKKVKDLEYIDSVWQKLTYWQQMHIYWLLRFYLAKSWIRRIPLRWIEYQIELEKYGR